MANKICRYLKSKLYRLGFLKKKTPLFVIAVTHTGFVYIQRGKKKTIFVSNIQENIYNILLLWWIRKPHRTIIINTTFPQKWYSKGKIINKSNYDMSEMILEKIKWMAERK
jgi:hypothetical protein